MMRSLGLCLFLAACGTDVRSGDDDGPDAAVVPQGESDPFAGLPTGVDQWTALCARGYRDAITTKFCAGTAPPALTSLVELQSLLGLRVYPNPTFDPSINANVRVTFAAHSTGIGLRTVTQLTPRAFIMTTPLASGAPNPSYQVLAFTRGEPLVELVANDPVANTLRFFLVRFHLACEPNCNYADLLTPSIESGWTAYTIYDDETIKNTTVDCFACHQPGGPGTRKLLRMQEFAGPWAHWFYIEHANNRATMMDFHAAHGTADYAGVPAALIDPSRPITLQKLLANNGFGTQPNAFDSTLIETELKNTGSSATWNALYAKAVAGDEIPVPYFGVPHTDPAKVSGMIAAYQEVMAGTRPRDQLPDIRATLFDAALPAMSIRPKVGLDGRGILVHMCRTCHNSRLDQTQSRALFNIDALDQMPRATKDMAIKRLLLPDTDAKKMPPSRFHTLSTTERDLAISELEK